ncbi:MAG: response regulator transcription factor [Candidatus Competibacteraceae bacterium]
MPELTQATVYVVDDDEAILESLGALFSSVGMKVGTFASAQAFLDFLDKQSAPCIGCLLVDVRMPGLSGLELQAQLAQRQPHLPVIVITGHGDIAMAVRAMKAGAKDFIEKPFNEQMLLEQVQACLAENWRTQQELDELQATQARLNQLTQRERSVLALLMQGKPSKVIADDLGISPKTVDVHRSNIMDKVGVRSLAELIRRVVKLEKSHLHQAG